MDNQKKLLETKFELLSSYPPELIARFNSFITTEFDDSLTVEMQLRSIIKWASKNFLVVDDLIKFINELTIFLKAFMNQFDVQLEETIITILTEWQESGKLDVVISEVLQWELTDFKATTEQNFLSVNQQLQQTATKTELEVEKSRIDNFVSLPVGSTTGDAELIDGRITFDGYEYPNIGESIRSQTKDTHTLLSRAIGEGYSSNLNTINLWEQGLISGSTGQNDDSPTYQSTRIRTKDFISPIIERITSISGYIFNVMQYDGDDNYLERIAYRVSDFVLPIGYKYRVVVEKAQTPFNIDETHYMNINFYADTQRVFDDVENLERRATALEEKIIFNQYLDDKNILTTSSAFEDSSRSPFVLTNGTYELIEKNTHTGYAFKYDRGVNTSSIILEESLTKPATLFMRLNGTNLRLQLNVFDGEGNALGVENLTTIGDLEETTDYIREIKPTIYTSGVRWRLIVIFDTLTLDYVNMAVEEQRIYGIKRTERPSQENDITNPIHYKGNDIQVFTKGIAVGDSLTEGVFNYTQDGGDASRKILKYSYPSYLEKETGIEITNMGSAGDYIRSYYTKFENEDFSGYEFALIQLGVNDVYKEDGGFGETSIEYLTLLVDKLKTENKDIKIFISGIGKAYSDGTSLFNSADVGLQDFAENTEDCYFINNRDYSEIKKGTAYVNGHLTAYGYWKQAQEFKAQISYIINQNKDDFKYVQFIGTNFVQE